MMTFLNRTSLKIIEKEEKRVSVKHICGPEDIEFHKEWIELKRQIKLIEADILPKEKIIKLREDHGRDSLEKFANKLIRVPFVVKIINSLPFNKRENKFIKT